jgi:diguanylate cyclase (GGDEF)-like protein/PAS domain S-box-containing protein
MGCFSSSDNIINQVESLKRELKSCREARALLEANELKYRTLVENANEAIFVAQHGSIQYANTKAENLFGYTLKELTAKPLTAFIHEKDNDMVIQWHASILKGEIQSDLYSFRIVNKAGAAVWVELQLKLLSWDNQPAVMCFITDITKRKQAEEKYHHALESRLEGFLLLDEDRIINDVNKALLKISGYSRDDFIGHPIDKFYNKASVVFYSASLEHFSYEGLFLSIDGRQIPMLFNRSTLKDENGKITGYMYFLTDLTDLKATQEELRTAEQRYRNMYQHALQGMFQCKLSGEFIRANPSCARILGYDSEDEVLSLKNSVDKLFFRHEDLARLIATVQEKGNIVSHELRLKRKNGKPVWILANVRYIANEKGDDILEGILVDNTKKKALERELRRDRKKFRNLSIHDSLTGLYNTRYLYQALDILIEESKTIGRPFSLVFMDMDNFKQVVDTYGHLNGSQALKEVAHTIKSCIESPCFGVAYGGDEFVIVLPGYGKAESIEKIEHIRRQMKQTTYLSSVGCNVYLGASFGIATFPDDTDHREGLLALADQAMFRIKQKGKDSIGVTANS